MWNLESPMGLTAEFKETNYCIDNETMVSLYYLQNLHDNVVKRGFSMLSSFDGRHRSGKSVSAVTLAYIMDDTFWQYFESRVVRDHKEFVDALERLNKMGKKGGVIMVDEAGVSMSSSDWYERWMKTLTKMVQMFGYLCPVIFFVAPVKDFVDSRLRKMFHNYFSVSRYSNDFSYITPYQVKYNSIMNKPFHKKPIIIYEDKKIKLNRLKISKPPSWLLERYQELETSRKDIMFDNFIEELKRDEIKDVKNDVDPNKLVDYVIKNFQVFESKNSRPDRITLNDTKIQFTHKVTTKIAKYIKDEAEMKLNKNLKEVQDILNEKKEEKVR